MNSLTDFKSGDVVRHKLLQDHWMVTRFYPEWKPWPWANDSVSEVHCSHTLEHFERRERVHVMNELYRVLIPGGKATIIVPHWASNRSYGDMTHCWPPVSE